MTALMAGFAFLQGIAFLHVFLKYAMHGTAASTWLVNYRGGYVRRGILGEIIYHIVSLTHISPVAVCNAAWLACFAALCMWFAKKFRRHALSWWILPLSIFLCGTQPGRVDAAIVCVHIAFITILFSRRTGGVPKWLLSNLVAIFGINCHEMFFFCAIPSATILLLLEKPSLKRLFYFFPPGLAMLAASLFHFHELTVGQVKEDCRSKGIIIR